MKTRQQTLQRWHHSFSRISSELCQPPSRISTVTERGQTSIPAELREELHLKQGNRLLWESVGESELKVIILPKKKAQGAKALLGFARRFWLTRRTSDCMKELREAEKP